MVLRQHHAELDWGALSEGVRPRPEHGIMDMALHVPREALKGARPRAFPNATGRHEVPPVRPRNQRTWSRS